MFGYKKVLIVGATSGIGWALAERMVENGILVIVAGRRKERLDELVQKHGTEKVTPFVFDITQLEAIPQFAEDVTKQHPDLDCVVLNAGIQRTFNFAKPETVDFSVIHEEFTTNYFSYLHLTTAFLPFFQAKKEQTALVYTTSALGLVPISRCSNYCASKAALHSMLLCLRWQLRNGPGNVKIIELAPPAVQTELHDERHQPDIKNGRAIGMPIGEFTDEAWEGLVKGEDEIWVGEMSKSHGLGWEQQRQAAFKIMNERLDAMMAAMNAS